MRHFRVGLKTGQRLTAHALVNAPPSPTRAGHIPATDWPMALLLIVSVSQKR
jgi:hypothetical protein